MNLTPQERTAGREEFHEPDDAGATSSRAAWRPARSPAAGSARSTSATTRPSASPLRVGVIGTGDEGSVLLGAINPEFIQVKVDRRHPPLQRLAGVPRRPFQRRRRWRPGRGLMAKYGWKTEDEARRHVKVYGTATRN